jgi:hypothetical protein
MTEIYDEFRIWSCDNVIDCDGLTFKPWEVLVDEDIEESKLNKVYESPTSFAGHISLV